jgi:hypothetical protein
LSRRRLEPRPTIGARDLRDGRPARSLDTLSSRETKFPCGAAELRRPAKPR